MVLTTHPDDFAFSYDVGVGRNVGAGFDVDAAGTLVEEEDSFPSFWPTMGLSYSGNLAKGIGWQGRVSANLGLPIPVPWISGLSFAPIFGLVDSEKVQVAISPRFLRSGGIIFGAFEGAIRYKFQGLGAEAPLTVVWRPGPKSELGFTGWGRAMQMRIRLDSTEGGGAWVRGEPATWLQYAGGGAITLAARPGNTRIGIDMGIELGGPGPLIAPVGMLSFGSVWGAPDKPDGETGVPLP